MVISKTTASIAFLITLFCLPITASELRVVTAQEPPYSYLDEKTQQATGFVAEITREVLQRANIDITGGDIQVYPWTRSYMMVKNQPNTMLFALTRTPQRESLFKWVGPVAPREYWLWKMRDRDDIGIQSKEDLLNYQAVGVRGFAISKRLEELGLVVGKNLTLVNQPKLLYKMALHHHADLFPDTEMGTAYQLKKYFPTNEPPVKVYLLDDRYDYYLGINKQTPDTIVEQLQNALNSIKSDGGYEAIYSRYSLK